MTHHILNRLIERLDMALMENKDLKTLRSLNDKIVEALRKTDKKGQYLYEPDWESFPLARTWFSQYNPRD